MERFLIQLMKAPLLIPPGRDLAGDRYRAEHSESMANPEEYWARIADNTVWTRKWDKVMDDSNSPFTKW